MYQVYSQQDPGRPRWTLLACALLLLVTVGLAAVLVHQRRGGGDVPLDPPRSFPEGRLEARLPVGWKTLSERNWPSGIIAAAAEPASGGRPGRQLFLFCGAPDSNALPSLEGRMFIAQLGGLVIEGQPVARETLKPGPLGHMPGETVVLQYVVKPAEGGWLSCCVGRAAVTPSGAIHGVFLTIPGVERPRMSDIRLVDSVSRAIRLTEAQRAADVNEAMDAAGIRFSVPADATLMANADSTLPRLELAGGWGGSAWLLTVDRVPLIGSRTSRQLVEDVALDRSRSAFLPDPVQSRRIGDHDASVVALALPAADRQSLYVLATGVDEQTALLLVGRHEEEGGTALREACRTIVETFEVASYGELLDIEAARETAREHLADPDLTEIWSVYEQDPRLYNLRSPGYRWGRQLATYRQMEDQDQAAWSISIDLSIDAWLGIDVHVQDEWRIGPEPEAYRLSQTRKIDGKPTREYRERRVAGADQVETDLTILEEGHSVPRTDQIVPIDDAFACEPVLIRAGSRVAHDPEQRPAIFTAVSTYARHAVHWIMVPQGEKPLPGGESIGKARAVRIQLDHSPSPAVFYYDEAGSVVAVSFATGEWHELAEEADWQVGTPRAGGGPAFVRLDG